MIEVPLNITDEMHYSNLGELMMAFMHSNNRTVQAV